MYSVVNIFSIIVSLCVAIIVRGTALRYSRNDDAQYTTQELNSDKLDLSKINNCAFTAVDPRIAPVSMKSFHINSTHTALSCETHSSFGSDLNWTTDNKTIHLTTSKYTLNLYSFERNGTSRSIVNVLEIANDLLESTEFVCLGIVDMKICKVPFVLRHIS